MIETIGRSIAVMEESSDRVKEAIHSLKLVFEKKYG